MVYLALSTNLCMGISWDDGRSSVSWVLGESLEVQFDEVVCNSGLLRKQQTKTHPPPKNKTHPPKNPQKPTNQRTKKMYTEFAAE